MALFRSCGNTRHSITITLNASSSSSEELGRIFIPKSDLEGFSTITFGGSGFSIAKYNDVASEASIPTTSTNLNSWGTTFTNGTVVNVSSLNDGLGVEIMTAGHAATITLA